jgi:hypothetical protein
METLTGCKPRILMQVGDCPDIADGLISYYGSGFAICLITRFAIRMSRKIAGALTAFGIALLNRVA